VVLVACTPAPEPEEPPVVVGNNPGEIACRGAADAQGATVNSVSGPDIAEDGSGRVIGTQFAMNVTSGGQARDVSCIYNFDTSQAQISGL